MPLQTLCRPLAILLVVLLAACAQQQKQTKGTPPLTDEDAQPAPVVSGEPIPEGQVDPERAAAFEECYRYADAQIRADQRIDRDIDGRYSRGGIGGDFGAFRQQQRPYEYERRRKQLFEQCLRQRGYSAQ